MNSPSGLGPDPAILLQWALGAVIVVLYARDRFDKPQSARSMTTQPRYWVARVGYIFSMLLQFLVLGGAVGDADVRSVLGLVGAQANLKEADRLPGPLLAALVLTAMLPHIETLAKIDEAIKKWFQRIGNIPFEVIFLSGHLQSAEFRPGDVAIARADLFLRSMGVDAAWLDDTADTSRRKWARAAMLWKQVQDWKGARSYSAYLIEHHARVDDIQARFDSLAGLLAESGCWDVDSGGGAGTPSPSLRRKLGKDIDGLYCSVVDLVASGVLVCEWNVAQRNAALARLGYASLPAGRGGLSVHEVFLVAGLIFLAMILITLLSRRFVDATPLPPIVRVLITVPIVYAIAIVVAIYPKAIWPFADVHQAGHRPYAAYAVSGLVAAAASFVVSLLFRFLFEGDGNLLAALSEHGRFLRAVDVTLERWPWLLMTAMCTVAIAFAADDGWRGSMPRWLRGAEAAAMTAFFVLAKWITVELLVLVTQRGPGWYEGMPRMRLAAPTVGACIGYFVPHMYQTKRSATERGEPMSLTPVKAP